MPSVILRNRENQSGFVVQIIWFGPNSLDPVPHILSSSLLHSFNTATNKQTKKCGNVFYLTDKLVSSSLKPNQVSECGQVRDGTQTVSLSQHGGLIVGLPPPWVLWLRFQALSIQFSRHKFASRTEDRSYWRHERQ